MTSPAAPQPATRVASRTCRYEADLGIDGNAAARVVVDVVWPRRPAGPVLFCLPGGAMNRAFYDLTDDGDESFSFARQMAARGFVSVLVDPPGIGDSDRPEDGFALTPERLADALVAVHRQVCADLQSGDIDPDLPALPGLTTVGVGHSMGALLTVLQQHRHRQHAGIALLGFGTAGLPQYLPAEAAELAADRAAVRAEMVRLARAMFGVPYPEVGSGGGDIYASDRAERAGVRALKRARDRLLPVPAFMSMLPGNVAPEAAGLAVPVYVALGDQDFAGSEADARASFTGSRALSVQTLPDTGHSFFLFPSRHGLFDGLAAWAGALDTAGFDQR